MPLKTAHLGGYATPRSSKGPACQGFFPGELIDNASGAGSTLQAAELNKDGAVDMVTGNKLGTFIFWGKPHPAADKTLETLIVCRSWAAD